MSGVKILNDEVWVAEDRIVKVTPDVINQLKAQAARNPRRRVRLCAHRDVQDRLHEMLIVMAGDMYVHPHKHLKKTESFHIIEGSATIIFFDERGRIEDSFKVGAFQAGGLFYFRNDEPRYHTQLITSDFLVVHEIANGPFVREETVFASWAPFESDREGAQAYVEKLKRDVGLP